MPIDNGWGSRWAITGGPYPWSSYLWNALSYATTTTATTMSSSTINWLQEEEYSIVRSRANYGVEVRVDEAATTEFNEVAAAVQSYGASITAARDRADELLRSMLSDDQRESYRLTGEFIVIGSAGGVYRVRRGNSGNIDWLRADGSVGGRLCAHPDMRESWLPDQDVALAQLLALTTDEAAFVRVANVHSGQRPRVTVRG